MKVLSVPRQCGRSVFTYSPELFSWLNQPRPTLTRRQKRQAKRLRQKERASSKS